MNKRPAGRVRQTSVRLREDPDSKKKYPSYDLVVKDLFQVDRPSLLGELAGGREIVAFLNSELGEVHKRVADLLIWLSDGTILHLDFQSSNHRRMPYRVGIYGLMAAEKYKMSIVPVVLYMGEARMRMRDRLDIGGIQVAYRLMDIRELDSKALMASGNPADLALAMLARDGVKRLRQIIRRANELPPEKRQRVLAQMALLSGLRGASEELTMEYRRMGITIEVKKNALLRELWDEGWEGGRIVGREEGRREAMADLLRRQLEQKFGPLPRWAEQRIAKTTPAQARSWTTRILRASTLDGVIGRR